MPGGNGIERHNGTTDQIRLLEATAKFEGRIAPAYRLLGMIGVGGMLLVGMIVAFLQMREALASIAPLKADVSDLKDWKRDTTRDIRWIVRALDAETKSHGVAIEPAPKHDDDPPSLQSTF